MPGVGFIRVKLLQVERGATMQSTTDVFDPYIAVNVKEAVNTPGKCTIYWKKSMSGINIIYKIRSKLRL